MDGITNGARAPDCVPDNFYTINCKKMVSVRFANRLALRGFLTISFFLMMFSEIIVYYKSQSSWQQIECKFDNCTRILFIADPQLIGNTYDKAFYSGLARFDSDRYLRKTFEHALSFTQPHILCFLGDLLDEGNVASPEEYRSYVERFRRIYKTNDNVKRIHVPGDNDIGGDNGEYISNANIRRFETEFMSEDLFDYENRLRFFKINRMLLDFTNPDREHNKNFLRIGLSHAPILLAGGSLLRAIINDLDPHVIFSGHWHESRIFIHPSTKVINFYEPEIRQYDLKLLKEKDHNYLEIMVPTTSYRMGKAKMGIGYGVIENYILKYTVLWQPNRFVYLCLYAFWLLIALCGLIVLKMMTRCPCRVSKRQSQYAHMTSLP